MRRKGIDQKKIFKKYISEKGLLSKIYKEFLTLNTNKQLDLKKKKKKAKGPKRHFTKEQTYRHGERQEWVRYMERVTWKLTLPYVQQIANKNLLYGSGNKQALCQPRKGEMGREIGGRFKWEGIYVYLCLIHVEGRQKTTTFCKAIILQ